MFYFTKMVFFAFLGRVGAGPGEGLAGWQLVGLDVIAPTRLEQILPESVGTHDSCVAMVVVVVGVVVQGGNLCVSVLTKHDS